LQIGALLFAVGMLGVLSCSAQKSARRESQAAPQVVEVRAAAANGGEAPPVVPIVREYALPASKAGPVFFAPPQTAQQKAPAR
jgi:hypothetical protein